MSGFGDEPPADLIMEAIDGELYGPKQPKVIMFDIGGVCVSQNASSNCFIFLRFQAMLIRAIGCFSISGNFRL